MNEERNQRPQRRVQQGSANQQPRRTAPSSQNGRQAPASSRPSGRTAGRPASSAQRPPQQRSAQQRPPQQRPAQQRLSQQRTRTAPAGQHRSPRKKVKRNYTRIYILLIAVVLIILLFLGGKMMKKKGAFNKGGQGEITTEMTTTTTTEPVVTEPPIVQLITFDTPSMYSVASGAELADYEGDQKMKVFAPQGSEPAEIIWNLEQMVGASRTADIRSISMEITCAGTAQPLGQCSSGLRALVPSFNEETNVQEGFSELKISDILLIDNESGVNTWNVEIKLPKDLMTSGVTQLAFVRYSEENPCDLYLDNIRLLDGYGNPIDVVYNAPGAQTDGYAIPPTDTTTAVPEMTTTIFE